MLRFRRIARFLAISSPNAYCDTCLALSLQLDPGRLRTALRPNHMKGCKRAVGACDVCGAIKPVTWCPVASKAA